MARDPGGLLVKKTAENGDREAIAAAAAERAFNLVDGWPAAFSVDAFPKRETFNQLIYIITAAITDIFMHGVAEWHTDQAYDHPALVFGSDNQLYASLQSSGGSLPSRNPAQTASRTGYWTLFSATGATGPAGPRGPRGPTGPQGPAGGSASVALANETEVEAGSSISKAVTPAALLGALFKASVNARWQASTTGYGLARLATADDVINRTAGRLLDASSVDVIPTPTGTRMIFYQAAAPSGWTKVTTVNDRVLRVVSGSGGETGGSWTISGISVDGHKLTIDEIPAHTHTVKVNNFAGSVSQAESQSGRDAGTIDTGSTGGGKSHTHDMTIGDAWRPAYADVIICSKN